LRNNLQTTDGYIYSFWAVERETTVRFIEVRHSSGILYENHDGMLENVALYIGK